MKLIQKNDLNVGAHFFIRDQTLIGRLVVQQKPIRWGDWDTNELYKIAIIPTIKDLTSLEEWARTGALRFPYQVYVNGEHMTRQTSWLEALQYVKWRFELTSKPVGLPALDLETAFLKNEPRMTFSEIHKLLGQAGVSLDEP